MTQEDKDLLLKDLCVRLPYGVKILHEGWNYEWDDELSTVERVVGIDDKFIYTKVIDTRNGEEYRDDKWPIDTFNDKLFLRPMSSMTKEEREEYNKLVGQVLLPDYAAKLIDWLNAYHFDYRGLIGKGLAIEVTKKIILIKNKVMKQVIIPEDKLTSYIKYCEESSNKSSVICEKCKQVVEVKLHPYFYDEDENDVYFAGVCPTCGELFIMKE